MSKSGIRDGPQVSDRAVVRGGVLRWPCDACDELAASSYEMTSG